MQVSVTNVTREDADIVLEKGFVMAQLSKILSCMTQERELPIKT